MGSGWHTGITAREKRLKIEQEQREEDQRQELARQRRERRGNAEALEKRILELINGPPFQDPACRSLEGLRW
ncbi:MAG: hypothetical protein ACI87W_001642 [Halieaceae bacterium]|jgi:hypothetical protein